MQHHDHDATLISGLAAGNLTSPDRARAQATLDACTECTSLHADLVAIAAATRTLPKHARAPRDFRLSADQAARLRRGSWLRAFLTSLAGARSATRPVAAAFTSLGIAGLLVVTVLPGLFGSAASMGPERQTTSGVGGAGAPTAAPAAAPVSEAGASRAPVRNVTGAGAEVDSAASGDPDYVYGAKDQVTASDAPPVFAGPSSDLGRLSSNGSPNPILVGSLTLLAVGLLLFGLRFAGRRLR